jgi:hypothetical protein
MIYYKDSLKNTLQKVLYFLKEKHNFLVAQRKKASRNKWNDTTFKKFKRKNEHFLAITQNEIQSRSCGIVSSPMFHPFV